MSPDIESTYKSPNKHEFEKSSASKISEIKIGDKENTNMKEVKSPVNYRTENHTQIRKFLDGAKYKNEERRQNNGMADKSKSPG